MELTEAGHIYYERCRRIVDEARLAHEQLGEMLAQPSGVLRASLPVDFSVTYLAPLIAEFANRYPGLTFDFDLTPRRSDLVSEPFDVAIRIGEPENSQLIARHLASLSSFASGWDNEGELSGQTWLQRSLCSSWRVSDQNRTMESSCQLLHSVH